MKTLTTIGFAFAALAWLWLSLRYFGKEDTVGGIIFLITAVISVILFLKNILVKEGKR